MTSQARAVNPETAARAVQRALYLLQFLDREHTPEQAYAAMRAVRHELQTVAVHLPVVTYGTSRPEVNRHGVVQPSMFEE